MRVALILPVGPRCGRCAREYTVNRTTMKSKRFSGLRFLGALATIRALGIALMRSIDLHAAV